MVPPLQEKRPLLTEPVETWNNHQGLGARTSHMQMRRKIHFFFNSEVINHQNKLPKGRRGFAISLHLQVQTGWLLRTMLEHISGFKAERARLGLQDG